MVVDCAAISKTLIESELFGHERGAFTGAVNQRAGLLELAAGGTLFLDQIEDLDLDLQPKLLRALEERVFRRVGSSTVIKVDARVIAASRKDLWVEVAQRRFREDLFFRLSVFTLTLPPLRERKEDIPSLVDNFAEGPIWNTLGPETCASCATRWNVPSTWRQSAASCAPRRCFRRAPWPPRARGPFPGARASR
jgi:transcriptional regulator with GAF, ATPase, and Fis domain